MTADNTWEAAQAIGAEHGSSRDDAEPNTHRQTRRTYLYRSRIRCQDCGRRMAGSAPRPEDVYYVCPHTPANPAHVKASPHHPRRVAVREDQVAAVVHEFCEDHLFSPAGRTALARAIPASTARLAGRRDKQAARLRKRLADIDKQQTAYAQELATLATSYSADNPAVTALRERNLELFASLEADKTAITEQLADLTSQREPEQDPSLLGLLPTVTQGTLTNLPHSQLAPLYQALSLHLTYHAEPRRLTVQATLTGTTPGNLAALLTTSHDHPASPAPAQPAAHTSDPCGAPR